MASLGTLAVNLQANASNFRKGISAAEKQLNRFSSRAKKAMANVGSLAAGYVSVRAVSGAISAAQTQMQAEQKLEAVIAATGKAAGLTAQEIKDYASELQTLTNFGDEVTINAASMLATFREIKGEAFKQTLAAAQDMSAVLDTDLKSSVIQLGKALNDPVKGLSALSRSGVSFTEQQKLQIKVLQESGDLLGAQKIILNELSSEFGGAAQAMADPLTQLKNQMGDLGEVFGKIAISVIQQFAPGMKKLVSWFEKLIAPVRESIVFLGGLVVKSIAVVGAIALVVKVVNLLINALKAARAAQIAFLAMTGPAGWGMIFAGAALAVAGVAGLEYALHGAADEQQRLNKLVEKSKAFGKGGGAGQAATEDDRMLPQGFGHAGIHDVEKFRGSIRKPRESDKVKQFTQEMAKLKSELTMAHRKFDIFASEGNNYAFSLAKTFKDSRAELSGFNSVMEKAQQDLADLKNNITADQKESRKFLAMGLDQSEVDQLSSVRKQMDEINKQRQKEQALAAQRDSNQQSFNQALEDTRNRLGMQLGTISKIDSIVNQHRKLGIDDTQLAKLRSLLEKEQEVIKQKQAAKEREDAFAAKKAQWESDVESQMRSSVESDKEANKRRADGGTFGSAKAAETIMKASRQSAVVVQQKITNKTLAKMQIILQRNQEFDAQQGAIL